MGSETKKASKKKCKNCSESKPFSEFHANKRGRHGVDAQCKECRNSKRRKPKKPEDPTDYDMQTKKDCSKCKQSLPLHFFYRNRYGKHKRVAMCKECKKKAYRSGKETDKEYVRDVSGLNPVQAERTLAGMCYQCGEVKFTDRELSAGVYVCLSCIRRDRIKKGRGKLPPEDFNDYNSPEISAIMALRIKTDTF